MAASGRDDVGDLVQQHRFPQLRQPDLGAPVDGVTGEAAAAAAADGDLLDVGPAFRPPVAGDEVVDVDPHLTEVAEPPAAAAEGGLLALVDTALPFPGVQRGSVGVRPLGTEPRVRLASRPATRPCS